MAGMEHSRIYALWNALKEVLTPLTPHLVFFQQEDVEWNCRWICNLRGKKFTQGRCGIFNDDDFRRAGEFWTRVQNFILPLVYEWEVPMLIIKNKDYRWDEYMMQIGHFLQL
jgi:hypothetical protein